MCCRAFLAVVAATAFFLIGLTANAPESRPEKSYASLAGLKVARFCNLKQMVGFACHLRFSARFAAKSDKALLVLGWQ